MGVGDLLLSPDNSDLIVFLKKLARIRLRLIDYFIDGYLLRPTILDPPSKVYTQLIISGGGMPLLDYDELSLSAWQSNNNLIEKNNEKSMKTIAIITKKYSRITKKLLSW